MIDFTEDGLEGLLSDDVGGPVVMLNLLRFRPEVGESAYLSYVEHFGSSGIGDKYGVEIVYAGTGSTVLVGEEGQAWDMVAVIRYPSRRHFVDMVRDPLYREFEHLRTDALVESVLQGTFPL